jgi:hypothetical protein
MTEHQHSGNRGPILVKSRGIRWLIIWWESLQKQSLDDVVGCVW